MENEYWNKRVDIGLVLLVMGVPFGRIIFELLKINQTTVSYSFSNLFMIMGLLFIIDYKNLLCLKFPRLTKYTLLYIMFLFYVLFSLAISKRAETTNFLHILFSFIGVLAISTQERHKTSKKFIAYMFWTGLVYTIYCGYISTKGFRDFHFYSIQALPYGTSKMSTARGILYALTAMMLYVPKNKIEKALKYIFAICALFGMLTIRVRTVLLALCITLLVYILILKKPQMAKINKKMAINFMVSLLGILLATTCIFLYIPMLGPKIVGSVKTMFDAIYTFFLKSGTDYSAGVRSSILDVKFPKNRTN